MNKFKYLIVLFSVLLAFISQSGFAQDQSQFDEWERQVEISGFGEKFSLMPGSSAEYDYYLVDLTKLPTRFERIYFLNLVFASDSIVNIDPDINDAEMWFKAYHQYKPEEIECLFNTYRDEATGAYNNFSSAERESWMKSHDKYNSK